MERSISRDRTAQHSSERIYQRIHHRHERMRDAESGTRNPILCARLGCGPFDARGARRAAATQDDHQGHVQTEVKHAGYSKAGTRRSRTRAPQDDAIAESASNTLSDVPTVFSGGRGIIGGNAEVGRRNLARTEKGEVGGDNESARASGGKRPANDACMRRYQSVEPVEVPLENALAHGRWGTGWPRRTGGHRVRSPRLTSGRGLRTRRV